MTTQGHVHIIEDDDSLRCSLQELLSFAGFQVRAWPAPASFLDELPQVAPAVVVTDMRMPMMSGLELHEELLRRGRSMPVVYISGESSVAQGISAMKLGALDFLVKPFTREELLRAVSAGVERDRHQMMRLIEQTRFEQALGRIAPREREVLTLLLKGYKNAEIVEAMNISLPTAKQYKMQLMRKLGVRSLAELIQFSAVGGITPARAPGSE